MNHSPETPLLLFYSDVVPNVGHVGRDMASILRLCTATDKLLGRRTLVSDLTAGNFMLFMQAISNEGMSAESSRRAASALRCVWNAAAAAGLAAVESAALKQFVGGFSAAYVETPPPDGKTSLTELCEKCFALKTSIRSEKTRYQYRLAIREFSRFLGHTATLDDLTDDAVAAWLNNALDSTRSVNTVRERVGRVQTLWAWLARRGEVRKFPTVLKPPSVDPLPQALTADQLRALFKSAEKERKAVAGIPGAIWWKSYLAFIWNTSERKSAALSVRIEWLDLERGQVSIPPATRKGGRKWGLYPLWEETIPLLREVIAAGPPNRELVWPWLLTEGAYYTSYGRILKDAGIPVNRKTKTHGLRCSHATYLQIAGGDPTAQLGHGDAATTQRHYLDAAMTRKPQPKLFVPWVTPAG